MMENFEKVGVEVEEESLDRMVLVRFNCSHFLRPAVPILNSESYEGWPDRAFPEFTIFWPFLKTIASRHFLSDVDIFKSHFENRLICKKS